MPDEIGLALSGGRHYLVDPKIGAVVTLRDRQASELSAYEAVVIGYERVTRDELFNRWPEWREIYDRAERKLADEGLA